MTATGTNRWRGVVAIALVAGTVGIATRRPELVLLAVPGVAYAVYPRLSSAPTPDLELARRLDDASPVPGEAVTVDVTVRNRGEANLPDLRVVDGVPAALSVVSGSPRHGTALRPGDSATFSYVVEAREGRHRFEPATVVARDVCGAHERVSSVDVGTELSCTAPGSLEPSARRTTVHAGRIVGATGGAGVEFDRSRAYRSGDPVGRIDWNRYARRRELTTALYREERASTVVVALDARPPGYRGIDGGPNAIASSASATEGLAADLIGDRNRVGVVALGWPGSWLAPGTGRDHLLRVREHLATHRAFGPRPPGDWPADDDGLDGLRARLPDDAQVVVFTPLCDDEVVDAVRTLAADGVPATVVSPDVTGRGTPGRRLAAVERDGRIGTLRRAGVPVVDWRPTEPLATALRPDGGAAWA